MLILTRKPGQCITIQLQPGVDPKTPVGELLANGPVEVCIVEIRGNQVKVATKADSRFLILRDELKLE